MKRVSYRHLTTNYDESGQLGVIARREKKTENKPFYRFLSGGKAY